MKVQAKKSSTAKKRRVTHIRVHKAANGFTVHHELEAPPRKAGASMTPYEPDPKPSVFTDKQAMLDHVGGLADQMGGDEAGAPEASEQPQPAAAA